MKQANESAVDGNAIAGPLSEVFAFDVTLVQITCDSCGATRPLASEIAYAHGPGTVLRCADCAFVVGRFTKIRDSLWLDLRGSTSWKIQRPT